MGVDLTRLVTNSNTVNLDTIVETVATKTNPNENSLINFRKALVLGYRKNRFAVEFQFYNKATIKTSVLKRCLQAVKLLADSSDIFSNFTMRDASKFYETNVWHGILTTGVDLPDHSLKLSDSVEFNRRYVQNYNPGNLSVEICCDQYNIQHIFWETYITSVCNGRTLAWPVDYMFDMVFTAFDGIKKKFSTYTFKECKVIKVPGISHDKTGDGGVEKFKIDIDYSDFYHEYNPPKFVNLYFGEVNTDEYMYSLKYISTGVTKQYVSSLLDGKFATSRTGEANRDKNLISMAMLSNPKKIVNDQKAAQEVLDKAISVKPV